MANPSVPWNTARATRRAALVGLGLVPVLAILHPENLRQVLWLYYLGDWPAAAGSVVGYVLGPILICAVLVGLICAAHNFIIERPAAQRFAPFWRGVLTVMVVLIMLCGLIAAIVVVALIGGVIGGSNVASLAPLIVFGGGALIWLLRSRWRRFVAAAREL